MNIFNPFGSSSESSDRSPNNALNFLQSPIDWIGEMKSDSSSKQTGGLKLPLVGDLPVPPLPGFNSDMPSLPGFGNSSAGSGFEIPGLNGRLPMPTELPGLNGKLPMPTELPGLDGRLPMPTELPGLNGRLPMPTELPGPRMPSISDITAGGMSGLPSLDLFDGSGAGSRSTSGNDVWSDYDDWPIANNLNRRDWSSHTGDNIWSDYPDFYPQGSGDTWASSRFRESLNPSDSGSFDRSAVSSDLMRSNDAVYSADGKVDLRLVLQAIEPLLRSMQQLISMMARQLSSGGAGSGGSPGRQADAHGECGKDHNSSSNEDGKGATSDGKSGTKSGTSSGEGGSDKPGSDKPKPGGDDAKPSGDKPKPSTDGTKPGGTKPGGDGTRPPGKNDDDSHDSGVVKDRGDDADSPNKRYADTGVERGRTLFRDDFNGKLGEQPNRKVFDTEHIGADGKTRQRGDSIQEKGIIDENNTVMDGDGHLQLFAKKERTWDPVAKEFVPYTKGSYHTSDGMNFKLDDHPNGVVIEVRAKHPTAPGAKFNALWIMTRDWTAKQGEKPGSTVEYDAAEGGGADIAIHWPYKDANGETKVKHPGGFHPKDVDFEDGKFHTYTVVLTKNPETGRGDVTQYIDGKKEYSAKNIFPNDKPLHIKASMEVSPKWTGKTLTSEGGMNSDAAGIIDYVDVSELKKKGS